MVGIPNYGRHPTYERQQQSKKYEVCIVLRLLTTPSYLPPPNLFTRKLLGIPRARSDQEEPAFPYPSSSLALSRARILHLKESDSRTKVVAIILVQCGALALHSHLIDRSFGRETVKMDFS